MRIIRCVFFCFLCIGNLYAQKISTLCEIDNFVYQVKQIDEFMSRFNLEQVVIAPENDSLWRDNNLKLLFDKTTYLSNQQMADTMVRTFVKDTAMLHFSDTCWYAVASCAVEYNKHTDTIQLILRTEHVKDYIYKWVIADAKGVIFSLAPRPHSEQLRISPADNEINFMSLSSICINNAENIQRYNATGYKINTLDVFNTLVYTKQLTITYVVNIEYHFHNICNYNFVVRNFNRNNPNSGWLISSFSNTILE